MPGSGIGGLIIMGTLWRLARHVFFWAWLNSDAATDWIWLAIYRWLDIFNR